MRVVLRRAREDSRIAGRGILQSKRRGGLLEGSSVNPRDGGSGRENLEEVGWKNFLPLLGRIGPVERKGGWRNVRNGAGVGRRVHHGQENLYPLGDRERQLELPGTPRAADGVGRDSVQPSGRRAS